MEPGLPPPALRTRGLGAVDAHRPELLAVVDLEPVDPQDGEPVGSQHADEVDQAIGDGVGVLRRERRCLDDDVGAVTDEGQGEVCHALPCEVAARSMANSSRVSQVGPPRP